MKFRSSLDKYRRGNPALIANRSLTTTVTIDSLSNEGDGVARHDGEVVFVPHTAPGDKVAVEIVEKRRRWSRAKVVNLIDASPHRVQAPCTYVEQCGGCTWQHIDYQTQINIKQQQLSDTLKRIGKLNTVPMLDIVPSPTPWHYRNRIRGVANNGAFHFHSIGGGETVAIEQCVIASPAINNYLASPTTPFSDSQERVELAQIDDNTVQAFSIDAERGTELGFRQVNDSVAQLLNDTVCDIVDSHFSADKDKSKKSLLDLYCGHGSWTRRIAESNPLLRVVGVDVSEHNIRTARVLAKHINNASFIQNRSEKVLNQADIAAHAIVVDPPRAGLSDSIVNTLNARPVPLLLYVSCHPATLARDLSKLQSGAYQLESVQAFDMFPQTPHVETLVVLTQKTGTKDDNR